jgi:hypothetical protein
VCITVHRITTDVDRYQTLCWDLAEVELHFGLTYFDAVPRADSWDVPPVMIRRDGRRQPDIWRFGAPAVLAFDGATLERLAPFVSSVGELLPLIGQNDQRFTLLNITPAVDCVDVARSILGPIEFCLVFREDRLPDWGLFKTLGSPAPQAHIFCVERDTEPPSHSFRETVETLGLEGIEFEPVWSSTSGPVPFSLMRF